MTQCAVTFIMAHVPQPGLRLVENIRKLDQRRSFAAFQPDRLKTSRSALEHMYKYILFVCVSSPQSSKTIFCRRFVLRLGLLRTCRKVLARGNCVLDWHCRAVYFLRPSSPFFSSCFFLSSFVRRERLLFFEATSIFANRRGFVTVFRELVRFFRRADLSVVRFYVAPHFPSLRPSGLLPFPFFTTLQAP